MPHEEGGAEASREGCLRFRHALLCASNLCGVATDKVVPAARSSAMGSTVSKIAGCVQSCSARRHSDQKL